MMPLFQPFSAKNKANHVRILHVFYSYCDMYSCARVVRVFYTVFCYVFYMYSTRIVICILALVSCVCSTPYSVTYPVSIRRTPTRIQLFFVYVLYFVCILVYSLPVSAAALRTPTGVASLMSVQKKVKRLKVQAAGGLKIVQNVLEFKQLCLPL